MFKPALGLLLAFALMTGPAVAAAPKPNTRAQAMAAAMKEPKLAPYKTEITAALQVVEDYMAAFNARDIVAFEKTFNFPTVRFASNTVRVIQPGEQKATLFETGSLKEWDHSAWLERKVLQAGPDKVHVSVHFARYRKNGSVLGGFDSLYAITKVNGHWGIQMRSSYAP